MCFGEHKDDKGSKSTEEKKSAAKEQLSQKVQKTSAAAGQNAKQLLGKVAGFIENSSSLKQLAVGAASGWVSGLITHRVGKTAGLTVGGSILLIAAAGQTGIININWDKVEKNVQKITGKAGAVGQKQGPNLQYVKKYARTNTYFAAGFIGGFLIGVCT